MAGVNRAIIVGYVGKDPEIKFLDGDNSVANFSIATSEKWKDKGSGEKQEKTEWHRIVAWGKLAEIVGKYVAKGKQVYVEGKIQTRKYTDKNGVEKYSTEIVARDLQLLGKKGDDGPREIDDAPAGDVHGGDDVGF